MGRCILFENVQRFIRNSIDNLDRTAAILGAIGSLLFTVWLLGGGVSILHGVANRVDMDMQLMIREEILHQPFMGPHYVLRLNYDLLQLLEEQGFSHIYSCGTVESYLPHIIKYNIQLK